MKYWIVVYFCLFSIFLYAQSIEMMPYLQTPTATSIYVSWFGSSSNQSVVQYGTTTSLGYSASGSVVSFNSSTKWHSVKLLNLAPNTLYYYQCITGSQSSSICNFKTPPILSTPDAHLRILFIGDTQYEDPPVITNVGGVVSAMQSKMNELYGYDWKQNINLIAHSGDIVEWAGSTDSFIGEYFLPFRQLSSSIPSMVARGNHDGDSYYYDFMQTSEIAGPEGKHYYSFDLGNTRFIFLDSNLGGDTQSNWLNTKLTEIESNDNIDFVFVVTHHFGHSEIEAVTTPESNWVQNEVIPSLDQLSKPSLLFYGHTHCYARGTSPNGRTKMVCDGGGGADLDRWSDSTNHFDYPEIHITADYWTYTLVDINIADHSYQATTYTLGNHDVPLDNVELDSWTQSAASESYNALSLSAKAPPNGNITLVSTMQDAVSLYDIMSSEFQVSTSTQFTTNLLDSSRNWVDFYEDSGTPDYQLNNMNAGIDLKRLEIPSGLIHSGQTYYWRVRYRSENADWGNWSSPQSFTYSSSPVSADFTYQSNIMANSLTWFNDLSVGDPDSWLWDLNGDGIVDSRSRDPLWIFNTLGLHNVTLTVSINGQTYSKTRQVMVNPSLINSPANIHITQVSNGVKISWSSVAGATSYRVYYFTDPNHPSYSNWFDSTATQLTISNSSGISSRFYQVVARQ